MRSDASAVRALRPIPYKPVQTTIKYYTCSISSKRKPESLKTSVKASLTTKVRTPQWKKYLKHKWKCPECRDKLPKSDNTNTPVRSGGRDGIPGIEPAEKPPGFDNVTVRKNQPDLTNRCITLENIREAIKQETTAILKSHITDELIARFSRKRLRVLHHLICVFDHLARMTMTHTR
ncbi:unnamed protein product [Leptidea sinapis]|uniref:Uncharacterized protein n=1 Tax=Leptidea sinapis TaxID=189913 RepID=A0A5E4QXP6_9NEOP|nr:unnamed protein product [Leptidea sinapis]